jgi:hypothetical protein
MKPTALCGLLLPYDELSRVPVVGVTIARPNRDPLLREAVSPRAVTMEALEARGTEFRLNHRTTISATIRLFNGRSGLYALVYPAGGLEALPPPTQWTGLSISFDDRQISQSIDWATLTAHIYAIRDITQVALCCGDVQPAYNTWALPLTPASMAQIRSAEDAHLTYVYGADYRATKPKEWWAPRPQASWFEKTACKSEEEREFWLDHGLIG